MKPIIEDIRAKFASGAYKNEEHVRVCIVLRILQSLGWNIWNPGEVNLEYPVLPNEDQTRVDVALFLTPHEPSVFIEVKALSKLEGVLAHAERQLRDYNRNNTALFSMITDGQTWRFYYSQAGGEFANKCFKILNLTEHNLDDLEQDFVRFLSREAVESGNSELEAGEYLQRNREQRAMADAMPEASRRVLKPPYPKLPEALVQLVQERGISISAEKAIQFIKDYKAEEPPREPSSRIETYEPRPPERWRNEREYPSHGDHIEMRWFDNAILQSLSELGGRASAEEVNEKIEQKMRAEGKLPSSYWEGRDTSGTKRWQKRVAARRYSLVQRGKLSDRTGRGTWELT